MEWRLVYGMETSVWNGDCSAWNGNLRGKN